MAQMQRPRVAFVDDEKDLADSLADKFSTEYYTPTVRPAQKQKGKLLLLTQATAS
jgi:hypothetical protein